MPRLIVTLASGESATGDTLNELSLFASVSRATNGKPVAGLTSANFRVAALDDLTISAGELKWQPGNTESSGCYSLSIAHTPSSPFIKGEFYQIGVQVRTFKGKKAVDFGQAVISVQSLGT